MTLRSAGPGAATSAPPESSTSPLGHEVRATSTVPTGGSATLVMTLAAMRLAARMVPAGPGWPVAPRGPLRPDRALGTSRALRPDRALGTSRALRRLGGQRPGTHPQAGQPDEQRDHDPGHHQRAPRRRPGRLGAADGSKPSERRVPDLGSFVHDHSFSLLPLISAAAVRRGRSVQPPAPAAPRRSGQPWAPACPPTASATMAARASAAAVTRATTTKRRRLGPDTVPQGHSSTARSATGRRGPPLL